MARGSSTNPSEASPPESSRHTRPGGDTKQKNAVGTTIPPGDSPRGPSSPATPGLSLDDPRLYLNRELSWLDFNERVLQLAEDSSVPLMERLRYSAIYTANLDEFYMVRVAGLHDQIDAGVDQAGQDGLTPSQTIQAIRARVQELNGRLASCFEQDLRPELARQGMSIVGCGDLDDEQRHQLATHFHQVIFPALTPLAVAPGRPFPYISNLSLSLAVLVRDPGTSETVFARVKVPTEILPRFVKVGRAPSSPSAEVDQAGVFVTLGDAIAHHLEALFPGMEIVDSALFRVTRDADLEVSDDAADLLQAVEDQLRRRRFGELVRVEVSTEMSPRLRDELVGLLGVEEDVVYDVDGLLDMGSLSPILGAPGVPGLWFSPVIGVTHPALTRSESDRPDVLAAIREGDFLVHHPYHSFATSVERFVQQAVADPNVLAIKQTVYRTSDDSAIVPALIDATERGKQAVALVELTARFDERANIDWARALEEAGVHVVYGLPAVKTHVKCILVVRREGEGVRNYVHIGTGNYHSATARLYTDLGLFTADEEIGLDVADMFNHLTGFGHPRHYRKVLTAPESLRGGLVEEIDATIAAHSAEHPARIILKVNALVDGDCIRALYRASQAGVKVDINVRGICCLLPGLPGISENITVVSVVGRLLEHSRIYAFQRAGEQVVYMASADLMPRNLDHRVELAVPISNPSLQAQLLDVMARAMADNQSSWELSSDGAWHRRSPALGQPPRSLQAELAELHTKQAASEDQATPHGDAPYGRRAAATASHAVLTAQGRPPSKLPGGDPLPPAPGDRRHHPPASSAT